MRLSHTNGYWYFSQSTSVAVTRVAFSKRFYGSRVDFEIRFALRENNWPDKPRFACADILSLNTSVTATATRESAVHVRMCVRACVHATHTHAKCSSRQLLGNAGDSGHSKPGINIPLRPRYIKQQAPGSRSLQNAGPEHVYGMLQKLSCYFSSVAQIPRRI